MDVVSSSTYRCVSLGFVEWETSCMEECAYLVTATTMLSAVISTLEGVL